ncbi:MAG: inositol monophosphatase, partial [Patescibacteria group bacterium]|nr:inositol monophosphatase [Patescibacteria group bacterium]
MNDHKKCLEKAVKAGGKVLKSYFGQGLEVTQKSTLADFRTKADLESEAAIIAVLEKDFSGYNIHSEEKGVVENGSEYTFVIDPLDGTNNFILGLPYVAVAIALVQKETTIAAAVYNPITDQFYFAEKSKGAFLNGKQIRVNGETNIQKATVSYICGYENSREYWKRLDDSLSAFPVKRKISMWAPSLDFCLLASGKIECIVNNNPDGDHDVLPGKLIAKEAGAIVTDWNGKPE